MCCIYNPPQTSPYRWKAQEVQLIVKSLKDIQLEQNCGPNILVGDLSFSETNWKTMDSSNANERLVLNTLSTLNYDHILDGREKQLDVLLTNKPESVINWKENRDIASTYNIEGKACSNHVEYEFLLNLQAEPCAEPGLETCAFKKTDWSAFNDNIREEPFTPYCYSNVNELLRQWYIWLWEKLRKLIPRVTSHCASLPPWVTSSTSHQLKKLKTLKKRINSTNSKSVRLLIKFKKMEKLLRQSLIEDQANYEEKIFPGRRFKDLQKYIHKIKGSRQFPKKMHLDDITATEVSTKAELFNKYFASTFQPNDKHFFSSIPQSSTSSSRTRQKLCTKFVASETKIHDILQKLLINKAPGHDGIGNVVLKNLSDTLPKSLSLLFQTCINKATFRSPWKTCKVTPIFKEGNKASVDCYRPISLLCSVSKVLEKLIFDTVYQHVEDMLTDCQYGFRKKRSTVLQMIVFLKEVYELYDSQSCKNLSILYLGFSKALDKVPHNRLLQNLYDIVIQGKILDLIKDYLTARTQFLKIKESSSSPLNVTSGVPQGSILGRLLFIIFVNDLPDCAKHSSCYGYCDDMKLLSTTPEGLQQDVKQLENWCLDNSMVLNSKKCIIWNIKGECNILLFNSQLQTTNVHRDLGVQVTGSLSWSPNCESSVQSSLRSFYQIKRNVSSKTSLKSKIDLYCG